MSWYDPTYAYFPGEIVNELGADVLPTGDALRWWSRWRSTPDRSPRLGHETAEHLRAT